MLKFLRFSRALVLIAGVVCYQSISAQESKSVLGDVYICTSIEDDLQRLACFDKAVPSLKAKEDNKEIVAIDAEQVKEIERDSFGFSLPSLPKLGFFDKKDKGEKTSAQKFKVASISKRRNGVIITLENGHIWQQTSGDIGYIPKGELTATIKPASLGSFFVKLENEKGQSGKRGARVKRIK